jgi:hypothetical protein
MAAPDEVDEATLRPGWGIATFRMLFVIARTPAGEDVSKAEI